MSKEPHHILYANRASAMLMLECYDECIMDCNRAIDIEPKYIKAYFRKAKALARKVQEQQQKQAKEAVKVQDSGKPARKAEELGEEAKLTDNLSFGKEPDEDDMNV